MEEPHSVLLLLGIFGTSFVIALSGALMPGPVLTVTISESSRRGFWAGPLIILGHALLELTVVILLLLGLGPFLRNDVVFVVVGLSGALILIWMAFTMFRSIPSLELEQSVVGQEQRHPVLAGILLSLANPYFTVWWATIGLGYMAYALKFGTVGVAAFFLGHAAADFSWYSLVSLAISRGRRFISQRVYRGIIAVCACALVIFAGWFGLAGIQRLFSVLMA